MPEAPLLDDDSEVSPIPVNKFSIWTLFKWPLLLFLPFWVIGALFKIQSWPYASELLTIGMLVFLFVSMLVVIFRTISEKSLAVFAYSFFGLASVNLFIIGALFKIQSWPYASELLTIGTLFFLFVSILFVIFRAILEKSLATFAQSFLGLAGLNLIIIGALFKIQSWSYANEIRITGLIAIALFVLLKVIIASRSKK